MTAYQPVYPTPQHAASARRVVEFFSNQAGVQAVLLTGSTARGKAGSNSCLDIAILLRPEGFEAARAKLEKVWEAVYPQEQVFKEMLSVGRFSHVDLEIIDAVFNEGYHGWTSGPDEFELAVGNILHYSHTLWQGGTSLDELKAGYLPYYDEAKRQRRLEMVLKYLHNNLAHIPLYVPRGLYFQSFNRLYHAMGEFLQALFISRRIYPISYDKWIKEQIVEILGESELYTRLVSLLEIKHLESDELMHKADELGRMVTEYIPSRFYFSRS
jgi:predicted nucleotidyltransferase